MMTILESLFYLLTFIFQLFRDTLGGLLGLLNSAAGYQIEPLIDGMGKIIVRVINLIQGTKFLPSINEYYAFLDSLTILEESCVFHIIIFMTLTFCVINIMGALFANELIKFFKLESRFPSLAIFFLFTVEISKILFNI
uniref:hypothetical protein n=1 Tax=Cyathus stercoreus TaxID=181520 RepID=UPI002551D8BF|nr:hypothetical protein QQP24_mgp19 [Cyathus stercoreus]WEV87346.1 hypothetical protein [Cyathus stercoreus]